MISSLHTKLMPIYTTLIVYASSIRLEGPFGPSKLILKLCYLGLQQNKNELETFHEYVLYVI